MSENTGIEALGLPKPPAESQNLVPPTSDSSSSQTEQSTEKNSDSPTTTNSPAAVADGEQSTVSPVNETTTPEKSADPPKENSVSQDATSSDAGTSEPVASALTPEQIRQANVDKLLSRVAPVGTKNFFKVLIYGPPGGSKSSFLNIPNTLIYDQEDGLISLKSWAIQNGNPIAENLQAIPFVSFAQADFLLSNLTNRIPELDWVEVFAIDTMNDFHRKSLMNEVVARAHANSPSAVSRWVPKTEHHQENNEKMLDFVRRLRDLDRNIILTAHSKTVEPKDKPAKTYPDFSESLANKIEAMMDIVGYMEMQEEDGKFFPVMRVKANAGIHAKSRVPLPPLIKNPTYANLKAAWQAVVDA